MKLVQYALFILLAISFSYATVANNYTFHGRLVDSSNYTLANYSTSGVFKIYDAPTGGNLLFTSPSISFTTDAAGIYSVIIHPSLSFDTTYYVSATFGTDPETSNRAAWTTVGYAQRAGTSESLISGNDYTVHYMTASAFIGDLIGHINATNVLSAPWAATGTGTCSAGYVMQNITLSTSGVSVQCVTYQTRVTGTCTYGINVVNSDGTVTCASQQGTLSSVENGTINGLVSSNTTTNQRIDNLNTTVLALVLNNKSMNSTMNEAILNISGINSSLNIAISNFTNKSSTGTITCGGSTILQNISLSATSISGQCMASGGTGTVTSITTGFGINRTTITSTGNLYINDTEVQRRASGSCSYGWSSVGQDGTVSCAAQQGTLGSIENTTINALVSNNNSLNSTLNDAITNISGLNLSKGSTGTCSANQFVVNSSRTVLTCAQPSTSNLSDYSSIAHTGTCGPNQFVVNSSYTTLTCSQPDAMNISNLANSHTHDAGNITSGVLGDARLNTTGVTAAFMGNSSVSISINVDSKGRITSISNTTINPTQFTTMNQTNNQSNYISGNTTCIIIKGATSVFNIC